MTRREYTELFPGGRPYKEGEIQVTAVPGMDRDTADVSRIRWNSTAPRCRASSASAEERVDFRLREDCERTPPDEDFAFEPVLGLEGDPSTDLERMIFEFDDFPDVSTFFDH
jgi:hypothetical protein